MICSRRRNAEPFSLALSAVAELDRNSSRQQTNSFSSRTNHVQRAAIQWAQVQHDSNRTGQFWQHESYDHWTRDLVELERIIRYIEENPVKAGLGARFERVGVFVRSRPATTAYTLRKSDSQVTWEKTPILSGRAESQDRNHMPRPRPRGDEIPILSGFAESQDRNDMPRPRPRVATRFRSCRALPNHKIAIMCHDPCPAWRRDSDLVRSCRITRSESCATGNS